MELKQHRFHTDRSWHFNLMKYWCAWRLISIYSNGLDGDEKDIHLYEIIINWAGCIWLSYKLWILFVQRGVENKANHTNKDAAYILPHEYHLKAHDKYFWQIYRPRIMVARFSHSFYLVQNYINMIIMYFCLFNLSSWICHWKMFWYSLKMYLLTQSSTYVIIL